jgi:hypothetical protein
MSYGKLKPKKYLQSQPKPLMRILQDNQQKIEWNSLKQRLKDRHISPSFLFGPEAVKQSKPHDQKPVKPAVLQRHVLIQTHSFSNTHEPSMLRELEITFPSTLADERPGDTIETVTNRVYQPEIVSFRHEHQAFSCTPISKEDVLSKESPVKLQDSTVSKKSKRSQKLSEFQESVSMITRPVEQPFALRPLELAGKTLKVRDLF